MDHWDADWLLTPGERPLVKGALAVNRETGTIDAVETHAHEKQPDSWPGTIFLTPGLVNAHTHLELFADRPVPMDFASETMADWILTVIGQSRNKTDDDRLNACQRSLTEMIRTGTTCVNDITSTGMSLEALSRIGMRGVVSPEFFHPGHDGPPDVAAIVAHFQALQARFAAHPLLHVGLSPHSPYNVSSSALQAALSKTAPFLVHTHLAENAMESAWFETGASPIDAIHTRVLGKRFGPPQLGRPFEAVRPLLSPDWAVAHGVYLSDTEMQALQTSGASLLHCPRSNLHLSGETRTDMARWQREGLAVGLGTDSRLSCPDLDLRAEARVAMTQSGLDPQAAFALITTGSATAMKLGGHLGKLAPGYAADAVLWHHPAPGISDPWEVLFSPDTQAIAVWINGRMVMERHWED